MVGGFVVSGGHQNVTWCMRLSPLPKHSTSQCRHDLHCELGVCRLFFLQDSSGVLGRVLMITGRRVHHVRQWYAKFNYNASSRPTGLSLSKRR